ncbi:glycosyltransferase family 2 protein [Arthrobacter sp. NtRootA1]|uniref:glycosyltransferase family 2 protein n=1 Tax=Arthrobacter sp. NtRootA1 TaxID=2830983 RepID=UPI001CC3938C|nr:glycosyltransferase family 2 protein [Arthrobacter sp. NtRootA1]
MSQTDILTVVIPAYNSQSTIRRAIDSCRSIANCRIIVVDDGSTDATALVAREAGAEVLSQTNAGASHARRHGIKYCATDFIALLDADDELIAAGVAKSIQMLQSNPDYCVVGGRVIGIEPNGREHLLNRHYETVSTEDLLLTGFGPWPPAASVIRKTAFDQANLMSIPQLDTRYAEDFELIIRLSMIGQIGTHDEPCTKYRLYTGKSSHAPTAAISDKESIRIHYANATGMQVKFMSATEIKGAAFTRAARTAWANNRRISASAWLFRSVATAPHLVLRKFCIRVFRLISTRY